CGYGTFLTALVTPTPDREDDVPADSVIGPDLRIRHLAESCCDVSSVSVPKVRGKPVNPGVFGDSASTDGVHPDFAGTSHPNKSELSADSFYSSQDLDPQTSHRVMLLNGKDQLKDRFSEQADLLSEKDAEIANLKSLLSLKEAEAAEAIRLRGQLSAEAIDATKSNELRNLEKNLALEEEKSVLFGKSRLLTHTFFSSSKSESPLILITSYSSQISVVVTFLLVAARFC
nr:hypothetical protein [Tanacetum cinerariifolium]